MLFFFIFQVRTKKGCIAFIPELLAEMKMYWLQLICLLQHNALLTGACLCRNYLWRALHSLHSLYLWQTDISADLCMSRLCNKIVLLQKKGERRNKLVKLASIPELLSSYSGQQLAQNCTRTLMLQTSHGSEQNDSMWMQNCRGNRTGIQTEQLKEF